MFVDKPLSKVMAALSIWFKFIFSIGFRFSSRTVMGLIISLVVQNFLTGVFESGGIKRHLKRSVF